MSREGNCWNNAVVDSCFGSLKEERIKWRNNPSRDDALVAITDFRDTFYSDTLHLSHVGGINYEQFEVAHSRS